MFRFQDFKYQYSLTIALFGADDILDADSVTEEKVKEHGMMAWNGVFPKLQKRMGKTNKPSL